MFPQEDGAGGISWNTSGNGTWQGPQGKKKEICSKMCISAFVHNFVQQDHLWIIWIYTIMCVYTLDILILFWSFWTSCFVHVVELHLFVGWLGNNVVPNVGVPGLQTLLRSEVPQIADARHTKKRKDIPSEGESGWDSYDYSIYSNSILCYNFMYIIHMCACACEISFIQNQLWEIWICICNSHVYQTRLYIQYK